MSIANPPPRKFGAALGALRAAQKTSKGGPAYSVLINRRLGRLFAAEAYVLGRTPNQVTAVSASFTFTAIALIALVEPSVLWSVISCLLLVVGYALDAADGQLARLRGGGSLAGEWLDHVVDAAKVGTLHLAVLISWYRFEDHPDEAFLVPIAFAAGASVLFFVMILNDQLVRLRRGSTDVVREGSSSLVYRLAVLPTDVGLLFLVLGLRWWSTGFAWAYGFLAVCTVGFLLLALPRWFRRVDALD